MGGCHPYDAEADRFFVTGRPLGGGYQRKIRTITGVDNAEPGRELNTCLLPHQGEGLGYNPTSRTLWTSTLTGDFTTPPEMRQVDPVTCAVISSTDMAYRIFGRPALGLDIDPSGNLVVAHLFGTVSVMQTDDPVADDVPWLTLSDRSGSLDRRWPPEIVPPSDRAGPRCGRPWTRCRRASTTGSGLAQ